MPGTARQATLIRFPHASIPTDAASFHRGSKPEYRFSGAGAEQGTQSPRRVRVGAENRHIA